MMVHFPLSTFLVPLSYPYDFLSVLSPDQTDTFRGRPD